MDWFSGENHRVAPKRKLRLLDKVFYIICPLSSLYSIAND